MLDSCFAYKRRPLCRNYFILLSAHAPFAHVKSRHGPLKPARTTMGRARKGTPQHSNLVLASLPLSLTLPLQVYLLAEILKAHPISSHVLYGIIREANIQPRWNDMALPPGMFTFTPPPPPLPYSPHIMSFSHCYFFFFFFSGAKSYSNGTTC